MQMSPELRASFKWQPNAICPSGIRMGIDAGVLVSIGDGSVVEVGLAGKGERLQPTLVAVNNMANVTVVETRM
jgi:hypothetical protein